VGGRALSFESVSSTVSAMRRVLRAVGMIAFTTIALVNGCSSTSGDAGAADAGPEGAVHHDAGAHDAGVVAEVDSSDDASAEAGVCAPGDITSFAPKWRPPPVPSSVCSGSEVEGFYSSCMASGTTTAICNAFKASHAPCSACLQTPALNSPRGALVLESNGTSFVNVAGCIALIDHDLTGSGCSGAISATLDCENAACLPSCPVTSTGELTAFSDCVKAAYGDVCAAYAADANAGCTELEGDARSYGACLDTKTSTFHDRYVSIAVLFCAQPISDTGSDGAIADDASPTDSSADGE